MVKFRNLALVIGINEYRNDPRIAPLTTARFDAIKLAEILKRDYDYDVELLTDDKQQATYDRIQQALAQLPKRIRHAHQQAEKVRFIFYFAGHGISSQGALEEAGYLAAQDSEVEQLKQFVSMKDIHDKLTALDCHHALIILDCCFAGAFKFITRDLEFSLTPEEITKERYQRYEQSAAWQVLASAAHDQTALDITLDNRGVVDRAREQPNSPFAAALFRAIDKTILAAQAYTPADYTKDGITTATELFVFLDREMEQTIGNFSHQQVPRFWPLSKHDKGEFFFETGDFDFDRLPDTPELSQENNPYRGLESFDEAQQRFFFGREELVKELQAYSDRVHHPFTVVLGVSGSGKSSLVKAGLIPQLRGLQSSPWQILAPMRPGLSPLKALAKVLLSLEQESNPNEFQQLEQLTENLRNARKRSPDDKALTQLLAEWRRNDPDGKLRLIITKFGQWQQIVARSQLGQLRQAGLRRSRLVLEHLEELSLHCSPEEQQALEVFYQHCTAQIESWSQQWQHDPEHLCALIEQWTGKQASRKLLLVIDQFEELITQSQESERDAFLVCLRSILQNFPQQLRVVATLRADFESRFFDNEQLQKFWQLENRFFVRPMHRDEFRQVIEGPAQDYVLSFGVNDKKYSLVDQLIDEVELMPGGLPLLSFTLSELYREYVKSDRNDRTLNWDDYRKLNGVTGSLTRRATDEYETLDEPHQATMRRVMLRMVTIEGGGVARRQVTPSELTYSNVDENQRVEKVINQLIQSRLLVKGQKPVAEGQMFSRIEEIYVEPAHDFLLKGWDELQLWLTQELENLSLRQFLSNLVQEWQINPERTDLLLKEGLRLEQFRQLLDNGNSWLNQLETEFVRVSIDEVEKERQIALAGQLIKQSELVTDPNHNPRKTSPTLGLLLALEAFKRHPSLEAEFALRRALFHCPLTLKLRNPEKPHLTLQCQVSALSHEGQFVSRRSFLNGGLCYVQVCQTTTDEQVAAFTIEEKEFSSYDGFSDDTHLFATRFNDEIVVWDLSQFPEVHPTRYADKRIFNHTERQVFSPDNSKLITGSDHSKIRVWFLNEKLSKDIELPQVAEITLIKFSASGKYLAVCQKNDSAQNNTIALYNEEFLLVQKAEFSDSIQSINFSSNNQFLIMEEEEGGISIFSIPNFQKTFNLKEDSLRFSAMSPCNRYLIFLGAPSEDSYIGIRVWDIENNSQVIYAAFQLPEVLDSIGRYRLILSRYASEVDFCASSDSRYLCLAISADDETFQSTTYGRAFTLAKIYDVWTENLVETAYQRLNRNLTHQEWKEFLGKEPYRKTVPHLPIGSVGVAQELAEAGDIPGAIVQLEEALELDKTLNYEPEQTAYELYADQLVKDARKTARAGDIENAISIFEKALDLNPKLEIDPNNEAKSLSAHLYASNLLYECTASIQVVFEQKLAELKEIIKFDRTLNINPEIEVGQRIGTTLIKFAKINFGHGGDYISEGISQIESAAKLPGMNIVPNIEAAKMLIEEAQMKAQHHYYQALILPYFQKALELNPELNICPEIEAAKLIVPTLLEEARRRVGNQFTSDLKLAGESFLQALELQPHLKLQPEELKIAASVLVEQGQDLAKSQGNFQASVDKLRRAIELDPTLGIDPEAEAQKLINQSEAQKLLPTGKSLLARGQVAQAIEVYEQVQFLDPTLDITDSCNFAARILVEIAMDLVQQSRSASNNRIRDAVIAYQNALSLNPNVDVPASSWNGLCWFGSLHGCANDVVFACEKAISLAPSNASFRDSRAIMRALTGDIAGAIEDFQFFVDLSEDDLDKTQRQKWIEKLQAGEVPFTLDEINKLF